MTRALVYEKKGRTAYLTLNRPDAMNAINSQLAKELMEAWADFRDDPEVWTAIVTGAGDKAFCAGADLKEVSQYREMVDKGLAPLKGSAATEALVSNRGIWKPMIAAINGYCLAGGLELALSCDIRIATEASTFGLSEVLRAIIPGGGGTQRLPRLVPLGIALEILMTGERIDAKEAYRIGLVNRLVPKDKLLATAETIAAKLNENGPLAVRTIKEAAYRGLTMPFEEGLRMEKLFAMQIQTTEDSREGPRAFAEKRKPVYKGK